ncbi:MurR/RpiR family transcriptional regulator [Gracilibacillus massiliensis]|uniref:MurR/RpiR family transcriptional regulator n=1 Tax=Gracilibacillus massiliensis TaxID=1564956 RepID=UPI00097C739A|nr:MurR/RpiR family transcriptional regulator [Gracilibacillus massiliensis]
MTFSMDHRNLTQSQTKLANYITKHLQQVLLSTEKEIADEVGVSIATVSRFWSVIGFHNMKEFKQYMKKELEVSPARKIKRVEDNKSANTNYLSIEKSISLLQETYENINEQRFNQTLDMLYRAKRVYVLASGPSKGLGELLIYRMKRLGIPIQLIAHQGNEIFEEIIHFKREDVILLFAFGRLLPEAKVILDYQRDIHYRTIMITDQLIADFTSLSSLTLFASRGEAHEFHSMLAPTMLIENIILGISLKEQSLHIERLEQLTTLRKRYFKELPR